MILLNLQNMSSFRENWNKTKCCTVFWRTGLRFRSSLSLPINIRTQMIDWIIIWLFCSNQEPRNFWFRMKKCSNFGQRMKWHFPNIPKTRSTALFSMRTEISDWSGKGKGKHWHKALLHTATESLLTEITSHSCRVPGVSAVSWLIYLYMGDLVMKGSIKTAEVSFLSWQKSSFQLNALILVTFPANVEFGSQIELLCQ